jgi:signal peptidase I
VRHSVIYINGAPVKRDHVAGPCPSDEFHVEFIECYRETLPDGVTYTTHAYIGNDASQMENTDVYTVPAGDYFMMGDNRDNSTDSRVSPDQGGVGYVPFQNLVGKAQIIFFSIGGDTPAWEIWDWPWAVRWSRLFTLVR